MKGNWDIMHNYAGGENCYQVYRLRNTEEIMHAGNLEIDSTHDTREDALKRLAELKEAEGLHTWIASYLIHDTDEDGIYCAIGYKTAVFAHRIHEAANLALAFAVACHHKTEDEVIVTDVGSAYADSAILYGKAEPDPLADEIWPE